MTFVKLIRIIQWNRELSPVSDDLSFLSAVGNGENLGLEEAIRRIARELDGKVASVKISACKPVL
jgi:hypothetical protein